MQSTTAPVGAVAIVTHNCRGYIDECLDSLREAAADWEVVIVDNGSSDGTIQLIRQAYPWVRLVEAGANIGFSAACNAGAAATTAPWILFLNPDTITRGNAPCVLLETAKRKNLTVVAPRLTDREGNYQYASAELRLPSFAYFTLEYLLVNRLWPRNPWRRRADVADFDPLKERVIEQPIGAAFLVRRDVFEAIGGFDERFHPLWFEDVDICKRLTEAGHEIWYEPRAEIVHIGQHTLPLFTTTRVRAMFNANAIRYVRKHFSPAEAAAMRGIAVAGTLLRTIVRAFQPGAFRVVREHVALIGRMIRFSDESRWYADG
jgi:N-acetylglucosaminyl-diphospho-decaprenol L-rhamnosyltransferase